MFHGSSKYLVLQNSVSKTRKKTFKAGAIKSLCYISRQFELRRLKLPYNPLIKYCRTYKSNEMKRFVSVLTFILLTLCQTAKAQTFLDNLRKNEAGKGKVTVQQSTEIDELVNGKKPAASTITPSQSANDNIREHVASTTHNETSKPEPHRATVPSTSASPSNIPEQEVVVDTRKKVMRNSYKVNGYRIQVFSGGNSRADRQKAEQIGANLKRLFPNQPIYVHFYSPSWKCRMGNFKTQEEAKKVLKQVKTTYNQACIIKGPISVQY